VLFVTGWALFVVILWSSIRGMGEGLKQVVVPGESELTLNKPGSYTIFHEYESVVGTRIYSSSRGVPGLECSLRSKATGAQVELLRSSSNTTYSMGGRSGTAYLTFHIEQPGVYVLSAQYPECREGDETVLAVGHGVGTRIVGGVLGSMAALGVCILLAVGIGVYTGVMRYRTGETLRKAGLDKVGQL
jgi:hypothetical protein